MVQRGNARSVSRRQSLGWMSAAAVGAAALGESAYAQPNGSPANDANLAGARVYNVRDFGAKGDAAALDTEAVQAAIDACHTDNGGTVLVPAGTFLIGTLELKSNVTLHIAAGGKLLGSPDINHYRAGRDIPRGNGNIVLISAADADNITIEGRGTIDGNGAKFFTGRGDNTGPGQNSEAGYFQRPHLLIFYRCRNLLVRDVFLTASAYHCFRILRCRYVRLDGIRIYNRVNFNNDGFHFSSSEHVNIVNCNVQCQDDACALFGSNRFVTVTNCSFSTRWSIFRFGGGDPGDIAISNCLIYDTYGCPVKMRFGRGSHAANITFSNIIFRNVTGPISIGFDATRGRRRSSTAPATASTQGDRGYVRNISFNGIRATNVAVGRQHEDLPFPSNFRPGETRSCIVLNGVGEDVLENISFTDVHVTFEGGGTIEEANREIPKMAGEYFEIGTPPAYGLYARNVRGLTLHNVRLDVTQPDARPAVVFDHVDDAAINGLCAAGNPNASAVLRVTAAGDVLITAPRVSSPATTFLRVERETSERITVDDGDMSLAKTPVTFADGAAENAVKIRI